MTKLYVQDKTLSGADLGRENPLPALGTLGNIQDVPAGPGVPPEMRVNMKRGHRPNPLPYTVQDGYSRHKTEKRLKTIVLENDELRATFLPEYGGRLWSLFDKTEERDLVYENPVLQPANLAIRNAWLSGGVEWNIGLRGHSPFTCSDVFAARVTDEDGNPVLRLYEYERIRQVPYQIDFHLPPGSRTLFVYVRIVNPHEHSVPMYWWSNIAYPEHPRTRVVVPAERAFRFGYGQKGLHLRDIPVADGVDVTYSLNIGHSADFFFDIPTTERKWIAAIDSAGAGLFQTSTDRLHGRKLFVWGSGPGGKAWQEFLAVPGKPYIEIQAGLAHTQMEHLEMPGRATWSWLEAYGLVKTDPRKVHDGSWQDAYRAVGSQIDRIVPGDQMALRSRAAESTAGAAVQELLHSGSGWGRLESEYRRHTGGPPLAGEELDFGDAMQPAQRQWLDLLEHGTFPEPDPLSEPTGYEIEAKWQSLLRAYVNRRPDNWYAILHLGLMEFEAGDTDRARARWEASAQAAANPWAYRNLARLAALEERAEEAVELYRSAYELLDTCTPLTVEYARALLAAAQPERWIGIYESLARETRENGRFMLLYAQALLEAGRLDEALAVIEREPEVTDLREGENSLTDIWYRIHERKLLAGGNVPEGDLHEYVQEHFPPPARIDFRMRTKKTAD